MSEVNEMRGAGNERRGFATTCLQRIRDHIYALNHHDLEILFSSALLPKYLNTFRTYWHW